MSVMIYHAWSMGAFIANHGKEMDRRWEHVHIHFVRSRSPLSPGRLPHDPPPSVSSPTSLHQHIPSYPQRVVDNKRRCVSWKLLPFLSFPSSWSFAHTVTGYMDDLPDNPPYHKLPAECLEL